KGGMAALRAALPGLYPNRRYVRSASRAQGPVLELFAPTRQRVPLHTKVRLLISFEDSPHHFELTGQVSYLRGSYGVSAEPGVGVSFEGDDKRLASEMIAFCAGKPIDQGTASRPPVQTQIRCRFLAGLHKVSGRVLDLSTGGLFVTAPRVPGIKVGAQLSLQLNPRIFGLWGKRVAVRVLWQGEKGGEYGFGAR